MSLVSFFDKLRHGAIKPLKAISSIFMKLSEKF
jgi:hypothetical protein